MYFVECPGCGAHLDPGEKCEECQEREQELTRKAAEMARIFITESTGQMRLAI